jgi:prepilin-type N-terminal cleavage/methylation domain-containing protein
MAANLCRKGAFTLIELLVVVGIVSLLISILLPSLSRAREEAKKVKCVANLKEIGNAMHMYFMEHKNWFPFEKRNELRGLHGFYYGGHPGRRVRPGDPQWWGYVTRDIRDTPAGRPFNFYLYPDLPHWDVNERAEQLLWEQVRDLPIYECPSDSGGFWTHQTDDWENLVPLHFYCGSSYDCNWQFVINWALIHRGCETSWLELGNAFLRKQLESDSASIFIILYEDPFDSASSNNIPRRGWHKQWSQHSFLFLDGHAANIFTDTTKGHRGLGWKANTGYDGSPVQPWYLDPDDPDYEYRNIRP